MRRKRNVVGMQDILKAGHTKTLASERMVTECIDRYEKEKKLVESIKKGDWQKIRQEGIDEWR